MSWPVYLVDIVLRILPLVVALIAWRTSVAALHASYRPVIRPVEAYVLHTDQADSMFLYLKNVGRGPAFNVLLFRADTETENLMGERDFIEPLGAALAGTEDSRVGRVLMELDRGIWMKEGQRYRLVYQDMSELWHETLFTYNPYGFARRYLGPEPWWRYSYIPQTALDYSRRVRAN